MPGRGSHVGSNACGSRYGDGTTWGKVGGKHAGGIKGEKGGKSGGEGKGQGRSNNGQVQKSKLPEWHCHKCDKLNRPHRTECYLCGKFAPAKYWNQFQPRKGGGQDRGQGGKDGSKGESKEQKRIRELEAELKVANRRNNSAGGKSRGKGKDKGKDLPDSDDEGDFDDEDRDEYAENDMDQDEDTLAQLRKVQEERRKMDGPYKDDLRLLFEGSKLCDITEGEIRGTWLAGKYRKITELDAEIKELQARKVDEQPLELQPRNAKSKVESN